MREERIKRGNEWWPSRTHNKFSRAWLEKLCGGVILLSPAVTEGHQAIDRTELTSAQFPPRGDMYQPGHGSLYSSA